MKILNRGLILLLFVCTSALSQKAVSGIVIDGATNEPLAFVNIGIPETGIGSVSDVEGRFILKLPQQVRDTDSVFFSFPEGWALCTTTIIRYTSRRWTTAWAKNWE